MVMDNARITAIRRREAVQATVCIDVIGRARNVFAGRTGGKIAVMPHKLIDADVSNGGELVQDLLLFDTIC